MTTLKTAREWCDEQLEEFGELDSSWTGIENAFEAGQRSRDEEVAAAEKRGRQEGLNQAEVIARCIYRGTGCSNHNFSIELLQPGCVSCAIADKIEAVGEMPKGEPMAEEQRKAKRLASLRSSYDHHPPECDCPLCTLFREIERVEKERDKVAGELRSLRLSVGLGAIEEEDHD